MILGKRTWLGRIAFGSLESAQLVAVMADGADAAKQTVEADSEDQTAVIWIDGPHTLEQWAAKHSPDDLAFDLAVRVDDERPLAFADMAADGALICRFPGVKASGPQLKITDLGQVAPLGDQFGVYPTQQVPAALDPVLYPDTGESLFVLADASLIPNLTKRLASAGVNSRCLFKNKVEEELSEVAPYLIELPKDNRLTRDFFTQTEDGSASQYYASDPCIFFQSSEGFDRVWSHARKFTRLKDEADKWYYLRFWDKSFRSYLVDSPAGPFPQSFFNGFHRVICRLPDNHWVALEKHDPSDSFPSDGFLAAFKGQTRLKNRFKFIARVKSHFDELGHTMSDSQRHMLYRQARDRGFATERGIVKEMEALFLWRTHRLSESKVLSHPKLAEVDTFSDPMRASAILNITHQILEQR